LLGLSCPDAAGCVNYKVFSAKAKDMVEEMFALDQLQLTSDLILNGTVSYDKIEEGESMTNLELFKLFKNYDKNLNGVLEINEYRNCLMDQADDSGNSVFTPQEVTTLSLMADINGDDCIDYEEFMKHFVDTLRRIKFMQLVQ